MITKEELLVALEDSSRALDKNNQIYGLALKGLESESTTKRLIQARDQWRKKHDDLADELDDKIIALEEKLKNTISLKYHVQLLTSANQRIDPLKNERDALEEKLKTKDADLAEASKIIDEARTKRRALEIQTDHLRNGRLQAEDQIAVLEDKLRDTFSRQYHDKLMDSARRRITALLIERDGFQRLVGEMHTEKSCMRADLEDMCKELGVLKGEIEKWEDAHRAKNADIDKLLTENGELKIRIEKFEAFFD